MKFKYLMFLFFIIVVNIYMIKAQDINKKNDYKIEVSYPKTDIFKLNNIIENKIDEYIKEFNYNIRISDYPIKNYSLIILYESYEYKNYLSYIFRIEDYTGGAHPNHRIYTINYDKKNNKVITIDDLIKYNFDVLKIFSNVSRKVLINNSKITSASMLYEGTRPLKNNFMNFVFTKDGIKLFFAQYQVAPYSQGEFNVIIPYKNIII